MYIKGKYDLEFHSMYSLFDKDTTRTIWDKTLKKIHTYYII